MTQWNNASMRYHYMLEKRYFLNDVYGNSRASVKGLYHKIPSRKAIIKVYNTIMLYRR